MKKYILSVLVLVFFILKISSLEHLNGLDFFPGRLNVCFSAEAIGNTEGEIEISIKDGVINTPFSWFNDLSKEYNIIDLKRLYQVKNREWNRDGKYPMNIFRIEIKEHKLLDELFAKLSKQNDLLFVEHDPIHRQSYTPNDPLLQSQWAIKKINAEKAWNFETGSSEIIIGICDSGVKWNHPDLAANIYINEAELPGVTINWETGEIVGGDGQDNDGNGYIDDVLGWDFTEGTYNNWSEDNNPYQVQPGNEHGTHVAGCAAAVGDNGLGVAGPAYNAKIMITKHSFTNQSTNYIFEGYEGVYYLVDTGAHIINCSWGGRGGAEIANTAASYAKDHGSIVVAAASNDNTDNTYTSYYPSDAIDGLSVAATNPDDTKASFSNYGLPIDVSSPGVNILATFYSQVGENTFSSLQGTSMASPIAAGVLGLIKSMYPEISVDSLVSRLLIGCDPIDHLNYPYLAGKLGAGRVNAYNSLMFDRLPYVEFDNYEIVELSGEDNTLNPGETLSFKISLKNRPYWLNALPFTGVLSTDNEHITINQSQSQWETIPAGENRLSDQIFEITVSDFCPIETFVTFTLSITADGGSGIIVDEELYFEIPVTGNKDGWPFQTDINLVTSSVVFDLNQDGHNEIIFIDSGNLLYITNSEKVILPGFPLQIPSSINNPITLTKAGEYYNIVLVGQNKIYIVNYSGQIINQYILNANTLSSAVSYDLNNDGYHLLSLGDVAGNLYLFSHELNLLTNYPVNVNASIISQPVFLDYNKDGIINIVVNSNNRKVNIINALDGVIHPMSPIDTGVNIISGIVAAENNHSTMLLLAGGLGDNNLKILNNFGNITAEYILNSTISTFPIITDLNNNNELDIVCVTNSGELYIFDIGLNLKEGFPVNLSGLVTQSPILVDFDNDNVYEILIPVNNGTLHAVDIAGESLPGFPYIYDYIWRSTPVLADIDHNQNTDLLISNASNLYYLALPFEYNESPYPVHAYNIYRNSLYSANYTSNKDEIINLTQQTTLIGNYPNPFNPNTSIHFSVDKPGEYAIEIFNIKGQKINTLSKSVNTPGHYNVTWTGTDYNEKTVSSGIYFYRLANTENSSIKKMILIK